MFSTAEEIVFPKRKRQAQTRPLGQRRLRRGGLFVKIAKESQESGIKRRLENQGCCRI
jgi:hypothetical protein